MAGALTSCAVPSARSAQPVINAFGGRAYLGQPKLQLTATLVEAGGGLGDFSFNRALGSMLGPKQARAEISNLKAQYGTRRVRDFFTGMDYAIHKGARLAINAGLKLRFDENPNLQGLKLARALVEAGLAADGTFWFDSLLSHRLHNTMMLDMDVELSAATDTDSHRILNQTMYDVARSLKIQSVRLAPFH
ncbi:MAG: hypothetical protein L0H29_08545 [Sinobacteraceae bacterium]|nr:hypothetical protein [Nevskiaceae bacterium]